MAIHMIHGLILKFKRFFVFGIVGDLENILILILRQDMKILIPFWSFGLWEAVTMKPPWASL